MIRRALTAILWVSSLTAAVQAAEFKAPWLSGPIIDEVGWIETQDRVQIEKWILAAQRSGKAQLQVYIPKSLGGLSIEELAVAAATQWKLGDKKRDDGVLFVLAPNERKLRIEVGQGLEGDLTDLYSKRIIDYVVLPHVREGNPSRGVREGVAAILTVVAKDAAQEILGGETRVAPQPKRRARRSLENWFFVVVVLLIVLIRLFSFFGGGLRSRRGWMHGLGGGGGGFGGFGSGGGGWSGGGGGFSGGGSSGSW